MNNLIDDENARELQRLINQEEGLIDFRIFCSQDHDVTLSEHASDTLNMFRSFKKIESVLFFKFI